MLLHSSFKVVNPGVYAMLGAGAMLGGKVIFLGAHFGPSSPLLLDKFSSNH